MPGQILVGVDGSDGSRRALRWAIDQAAARPAVVQAAIVWHRMFDYGREQYWPADEKTAEAAGQQLEAAIAEVAGPEPAVTIEALVLEGDPARILCARSATADLLVVGSRGHGGFAELVLGSVSIKCAHHSHCPIVIVPAGDRPGAQPRLPARSSGPGSAAAFGQILPDRQARRGATPGCRHPRQGK